MSESRICPVCENEIPEDATFVCPYCSFELKSLDDGNTIEKARKIFKMGNHKKQEIHNSQEDFQDKNISKLKHFIPSFLGVLVFSVWLELYGWGHYYGCFCPVFSIPFVLVGGIITYRLEKLVIKSQPGIGKVIFLLPMIILMLFWIWFNNS